MKAIPLLQAFNRQFASRRRWPRRPVGKEEAVGNPEDRRSIRRGGGSGNADWFSAAPVARTPGGRSSSHEPNRRSYSQVIDLFRLPFVSAEGEPTPGSRPGGRDDDAIRTEILRRLTEHSSINLQAITVNVRGGRVTLSGQVADAREKRVADHLAAGTAGVVGISSELEVLSKER